MPKHKDKKGDKPPSIKPIAFGEQIGSKPHNASGIVALDDSRFLFCDNNVPDALFELRLAADGQMDGLLIPRPITGLEPRSVDDFEGVTRVPTASGDVLIVIPSLSLKQRKRFHKKRSKRGKAYAARNCILRISFREGDRLEAEMISQFREWI